MFVQFLSEFPHWSNNYKNFSQVRDGQKAYLLRAKINGLAGLGKYQGDGKAASAAGESLFVANHQY